MTSRSLRILVLAMAAALSGAAAAQSAEPPQSALRPTGKLLAPATSDLVSGTLTADAPAMPPGVERKPLQFAWAIAGDRALQAPQPFVAVSREYWATVDAAELARGYPIQTTQAGALVRISPAQGAATKIAPSQLRVVRDGRVLDAVQSTQLAASAEQLNATGASFTAGTLGFKLDPALGAGRFDLQLPAAQGRYVVHVAEPTSPYALRLRNPRDARLAGQRFRVDAAFEAPAQDAAKGIGNASLDKLGGLLVAPDGRSVPLTFVADADGGYTLESTLPTQASDQPGLWEVHAFGVGQVDGRPLLRDAKIALAVAAPTARLDGGYSLRSDAGGLAVGVPVQTAAEGRYEVRAVLYGTDAAGRLRPAAVAHSADWLRPGSGTLPLRFTPDLYAGLQAPFELRQLSLNDQGRYGQLEYRERALQISRIALAKATARP